MTRIARTTQALLATALVAAPATALAQNSVEKQVNAVAEEAKDLQAATNSLNNKLEAEQRNNDAAAAAAATDGHGDRDGDRDGDRGRDRDDDDDDGGKWGLLGLLGLAGLLGLRRNDHHHHDHRDHRDHRADVDNRSGTRGNDSTRL